MAELEKVVISAEGRGFEKLQAKMAALSASANLLQQRQKSLSGSMASTNRQLRQQFKATTDLGDRYNQLTNYTKRLTGASMKFAKAARFLMFTVIGLAVEFAVVAASLVSVNAAFAAGNAIMKAYKWSMGGVAAAAAAVGSALAIAAAAQREFTAAQYAHTQKATPKFGSAMNHSIAQLRNLTSDAELAVFGVENLNSAFAAVSRNSQFTGKSQQVIRALRDFAAIGGDQGKSITAIGEFVGLLQKEGKVTFKVTEAARAIGPEFEKAFKKIKQGGGSVEEVFKTILSGDLSKAAGITGAADLMSGTLFGLFKQYTTLVRGLFADIGTPLLGPAKEALQEIFYIIQNGLRRISPGLGQFGRGPFLDTIVKATEKITDFTVKLFDKYLPQSEGMLTSIRNTYLEFKKMWQFITTSLDRLRDGGSVVIKMFGKPLKELFTSIGDNIEHFSQLAMDNKEDFLAFGDSLAGVVDALMDFAAKFKEAFTAALPTINQVLGVVERIIRLLSGVMGFISNVPFGGEIITGIAGYGILKGRRAAQYAGRRGINKKAAAQGMGTATAGLLQMMGYAALAGARTEQVDPITGERIGFGSSINTNAGTARINQGRIGSKLFAGGRFGRLQKIGGFLAGQLNPIASQRAAMATWDFYNQNVWDDKVVNTVPAGTPGAKWDRKRGAYVTTGGYVPNPNALQGKQAFFGRTKAAMLGGFSMGGMLSGAAISAFANSGMAPSMLRENTGAINLGAGLMAINPMLGLGAMGAGTLFNTVMGKGARTGGGGALTGAASGAALGAAVGSFIPVIGTGVGAIVGGLIGGVAGFFGGKKAERMVAREAAKSVTYGALRGITASLITGSTAGAMTQINKFSADAAAYGSMDKAGRKAYITQLEKQGLITATQAKRARSQTGAFGDELEKQATDLKAVGTATVGQFNSIMNGLQGATGKTNDELMELARTMNINLYDPTLKLEDAIKGLGLTMDLTAKGLATSGTDIMLKSLRVLDEIRRSDALVEAVDASARGIYEAGGGTKNDYMDFMQKSVEYLANKYPDNPLAQMYAMRDTLGVGGSLFAPGAQLQGLESNFRANAGDAYNKLITEQATQLAQSRSGGIMQLIAQSGFEFADGASGFKGLSSQLAAMYQSSDPLVRSKARELENFLAGGASLGSGPEQIRNTLASFGIDIGTLQTSTAGTLADQLSDQLSDQQRELQTALVNAIGTGFDDKPDWWDGTPAWWGNDGTGTPDTSSPRARGVGDTVSSRLNRTMRRHNYFDSMLTGKRSITSSWRNHSLGSPSSDHVTGNAYDLVGQNLGQYSTMINRAGGFAEFHGAAGSRHLHVVPPSSPVGDTGTSRIGQKAPVAIQAPPESGVTINVYATERQSEQEIARLVMNEITKAQRNYRERR